jgi:hypothetical protein
MANGWTLERRQRQAEMIRKWKPWEQSTGPRSSDGKAMSSQNAYRGGMRPKLKELSRLLKKQQEQLTTIDLD